MNLALTFRSKSLQAQSPGMRTQVCNGPCLPQRQKQVLKTWYTFKPWYTWYPLRLLFQSSNMYYFPSTFVLSNKKRKCLLVEWTHPWWLRKTHIFIELFLAALALVILLPHPSLSKLRILFPLKIFFILDALHLALAAKSKALRPLELICSLSTPARRSKMTTSRFPLFAATCKG